VDPEEMVAGWPKDPPVEVSSHSTVMVSAAVTETPETVTVEGLDVVVDPVPMTVPFCLSRTAIELPDVPGVQAMLELMVRPVAVPCTAKALDDTVEPG
jgi:hypothetical protein